MMKLRAGLAIARSLMGFAAPSFLLPFLSAIVAHGLTITIVAGHGVGDGEPALKAPIGSPTDIAVDTEGNLFIADPVNARVRRVNPEGVIATVAGTGAPDVWGDGGAATAAALRYPKSLAVDRAGTLYIADRQAHRIRAVSPDGIIRTVAGTGAQGFGGDGGPATEAFLSIPSGIATDFAGNLYIADTGNNRIRRVDTGGTITTFAGTGRAGAEGDGGPATQAELNEPTLISVDGQSNVYFLDSGNDYVRRIDPDGTIIGAQIVARVDGLEAAADGAIYVSHAARVWRMNSSGKVEAVAGRGTTGFSGDAGPATDAQLWTPRALALGPAGEVFVLDSSNLVVRRVDRSGVISSVAGNRTLGRFGDGGQAAQASYSCADVVAGPGGVLYVSDPLNHRVAVIKADGTIDTYAGTGTTGFGGDGGSASDAALFHPAGLAVDSSGTLYIADSANQRIRGVSNDGIIATVAGNGEQGFGGDGGPALQATLDNPVAVAVSQDGSIYISDAGNARIRRVHPDGVITTVAGNGDTDTPGEGAAAVTAPLGMPGGLDIAPDGTLVVAIPGAHTVRAIRPDGTVWTVAGRGVAGLAGDGQSPTDALLFNPNDVAVSAGGAVLIADSLNRRLRQVKSGAIASVAGDRDRDTAPSGDVASIGRPDSLSVGPQGEIYMCDGAARRILRVDL